MRRVPAWRRYARFFRPRPGGRRSRGTAVSLDAKVDDLVAQGWPPDAARSEAERQFGDFGRVQQMGAQLSQETRGRRESREYRGSSCRICVTRCGRCAGIDVCDRHDDDSGHGHRREHGGIQRGEYGVAAAAAVSRCGAAHMARGGRKAEPEGAGNRRALRRHVHGGRVRGVPTPQPVLPRRYGLCAVLR